MHDCAFCVGAASFQGDIDQYMKNVQAFTAKTGIEVRVRFVPVEVSGKLRSERRVTHEWES